jgi:hypothetical protein
MDRVDRTDKTPKNRAKHPDKTLIPRLMDLRSWVDNINRAPDLAMRGGAFKGLDQTQVFTTSCSGWEFGYRIIDLGATMRRRVFIKNTEQNIEEIPNEEIEPIMVAVFEVFLDKGVPANRFEPISADAFVLEQDFIPLLLTKRDAAGITINDEAFGPGKVLN